jgi:hypothetical protein
VVNDAACTGKATELDPAGTVTVGGAVSALLTVETTMLAPPAGALFVNVTVQMPEEFGPRLVGLQASEETRTEATRLTVALAELLL